MGKKSKTSSNAPPRQRRQPETTCTASNPNSDTKGPNTSSKGDAPRNQQLSQFLTLCIALPLIGTFLAVTQVSGSHFLVRLLTCLILDAIYGSALQVVLQLFLERLLLPHLPGLTPRARQLATREDAASFEHDALIDWPPPTAKIPSDWNDALAQRKQDLESSSSNNPSDNRTIEPL